RLDVVALRDVAGPGPGVAALGADLGRGGLAGLGLARGDHHLRAVLGHPLGDRPPDPAAGPGDHRDLPGEVEQAHRAVAPRPPPPLRCPPPPEGEGRSGCTLFPRPPWGRGTAKRWRGRGLTTAPAGTRTPRCRGSRGPRPWPWRWRRCRPAPACRCRRGSR